MILMTLIRLIALLTGAKRREFSGMIHNRYYNNHPSNPQQPPATQRPSASAVQQTTPPSSTERWRGRLGVGWANL